MHAAIMAAQALANPDQVAHLWGDVPALLGVAALLAFFTRRATAAPAEREADSARVASGRLSRVA